MRSAAPPLFTASRKPSSMTWTSAFSASAITLLFFATSSIKYSKVSKDAKIRNRYNQVPHLTQDTNGKVTNSQSDITKESQEVSPLPAGDNKAQLNRRVQRHSKHKTKKNIKDPQKKHRLGTVSKIFSWRA